ncbi:MAG: hypothetical protein K6U04_15085 [Armatimonadetes bacterium]|nr:hypothetical protein [Armatimonadota bacterium]
MQATSRLKEELQRLMGDRQIAVLDLGDRRVLITTIDTSQEYDLDSDLSNPLVAQIVAKGYEDYQAGRLVGHDEVLRRLNNADD